MLVYTSILIICSISSFLRSCRTLRCFVPVLTAIIFFSLFLPAAIRYGIGTDYFVTYVPAIDSIQAGGYWDGEISFRLLVELISRINDSPQWVFVVYSFFTYVIGLLAFGKRDGAVAIPVLILLFYLFSYNCIRQALALSFVMLAYRLFLYKRYKVMIFCAAMACFVHTSAFIFLPILLVAYSVSKAEARRVLVVACLMFVLLAAVDVSGVVMRFAALIPKYEAYSTSDLYSGVAQLSSGFGIALQLIAKFVLFVVLLLRARGRHDRITAILCGITIAFSMIGLHVEIFRRFVCITDFILPFAAVRLWMIGRNRNSARCGCFICGGIWLLLFSHALIIGELGGVSPNEAVPYKTIFSDESDISLF